MQLPWQKNDKKQVTPDISLYTRTVAGELAPVIRGITSKHDSITTDFFAGKPNENGLAPLTALKAWENPATKSWQIEQWTFLPPGYIAPGAKESYRKETLARLGACFFDALHECSAFQVGQEQAGAVKTPAPDAEWQEITHWRKAADDAFQACEQQGLVHPCANGQILTASTGFFDQAAFRLAAKSAPMNIENIIVPASALLTRAAANESECTAIATQTNDKSKIFAAYAAVIEAGNELKKATSKMFENKIDHKLLRVDKAKDITDAFVILALSPVASLAYIVGDPGLFPGRAFNKRMAAFNKAAAALPDKEDRDLCAVFAENAAYAFWMQSAKDEYALCFESAKSVERSLPYLEKAAAVKGLGGSDLETLKTAFLKDGYKNESFSYLIRNTWETTKTRLESRQRAFAP